MNDAAPLFENFSGIPNIPLSTGLMLTLSRGFLVLFWSIPLSILPIPGVIRIPFTDYLQIPGHVIGILLAYTGIMILRKSGPLTPTWMPRIREAMFLLLAHVYLAPFLRWWTQNPAQFYHAANVLALFIVTACSFYVVNMLASELARFLHNRFFRAEAHLAAWASFVSVLSGAGWVIARTSMETSLAKSSGVSALPAVSRWWIAILPLPCVITLAILWKAHSLALSKCTAASGKT